MRSAGSSQAGEDLGFVVERAGDLRPDDDVTEGEFGRLGDLGNEATDEQFYGIEFQVSKCEGGAQTGPQTSRCLHG